MPFISNTSRAEERSAASWALVDQELALLDSIGTVREQRPQAAAKVQPSSTHHSAAAAAQPGIRRLLQATSGGDRLQATASSTCVANAFAFVKAFHGTVLAEAVADSNGSGDASPDGGDTLKDSGTDEVNGKAWASSTCNAKAYASTDLTGCKVKCPSALKRQQLQQRQTTGEFLILEQAKPHGSGSAATGRKLLKGKPVYAYLPCGSKRGCSALRTRNSRSYLWGSPDALMALYSAVSAAAGVVESVDSAVSEAATTQQVLQPAEFGFSMHPPLMQSGVTYSPLFYGRQEVLYFEPDEEEKRCMQREMLVCGTEQGVVMAQANASVNAVAYAFEPLSSATADAAGDGSYTLIDSDRDAKQGEASCSASATATALAQAENLGLAGCLVSCPAVPKKIVKLMSSKGCVVASMDLCFS